MIGNSRTGRPRWRSILAVVLIAVGLVAANPPGAGAAAPKLTVGPRCLPPSGRPISLTFTGTDFTPSAPNNEVGVHIVDQNDQPVTTTTTDTGGGFRVAVTMLARPVGYHTFRAEDGANKVAIAAFLVPCPSISVEPGCGPTGALPDTYSLTVKGSSFPPLQAEDPSIVDLKFGGTAAGEEVYVDPDGVFSTTITPGRHAAGTYRVEATDRRDRFLATAPFVVPCSTETTATTAPEVTVTTTPPPPPPPTGPAPACSLVPAVGPPGFVTEAACSGFPAGSTAVLRWAPGLGTTTVGVAADGTFRVPVLILPRDVLGPREIVAEAGGVSARAPFLVVPPTVSPSGGDVATRFLPQLVLRR